jgi:predicted nucleotidyltransferase
LEIINKAGLLLKQFKEWSENQNHIKGVAIVGSFARGDFNSKSDVDLVIISTNKDLTLRIIRADFNYCGVLSYSLEEWGILTSLRVFYENGLEVEYGVVTDQWVSEPIDQGTKNVIKNGFKIVTEKENTFYGITKYLNQH